MKHLTFLFFIGLGLTSYATTQTELMALERNLENKIDSLVSLIDKEGFSIVKIRPKSNDAELPATPFIYKDLWIEETEGNLVIDKLNVMIYSSLESFPESYLKIVKVLSSGFGSDPTISVFKITPPPIRKPAQATTTPTNQEWHLRLFDLSKQHAIPLLSKTLFPFLLILVLLFAARGLFRNVQSIQSTLSNGISQLIKSLEALGVSLGEGTKATPEAQSAVKQPISSEDSKNTDKLLEGYSDEGLIALMTDCYWSKLDSYAAFLWHHISIEKRKTLLTKCKLLPPYARYLSNISEQNLGATEDPYYLEPLPIEHLDNSALAKLLKKYPQLFNQLSTLRKSSLPLPAKERLLLNHSHISTDSFDRDLLSSKESSTERTLKAAFEIQLTSLEEESELLSQKNITVEMMESVPSLGWLLHLTKEEIEILLKGFSARQLASAWLGPVSTLEKLSKHLPPQKHGLIQSYAKQHKPSRQSATYRALHVAAIRQLRKKNQQSAA